MQLFNITYSPILQLFPTVELPINLTVGEILELPQCSTKKYFASTTVCELTGRLAKVYTLRNEEYTINSRKNDITTVVSQKESKEQLYRRLMRYDIYCKVISSQRDKLAMKQLIDRTLKNYEGT